MYKNVIGFIRGESIKPTILQSQTKEVQMDFIKFLIKCFLVLVGFWVVCQLAFIGYAIWLITSFQ